MAGGRIKGITIELDGDTTKLTAALKGVESQIRTTQSSLKDVNKLLKLDPGNTDLLKQKYKYLGTEIDATKQKLTTLKEAQKQMVDSGQVNTEQYDALQREIEETEQKLKGLTKEYNNFGSASAQKIAEAGEKVQKVGNALADAGGKLTTGVTLPLVAGATAVVNAYGDVDKQFNLVRQTMGETANSAEDFQGLWDQMGASAKNSVYGMQDAADATLNFARQGFTAKEATNMLTPAMSLAAGTGTDLSTVTAGLGNSLKMFGADSAEAANYADVLAKAQAQANTDTTQLFDAMSVAGPICKTVGWDIKDLATITDVFGNAGISGSEGATALKTGIARLAAPAKDGSIQMHKLGLETGQTHAIFNDDGSMKSMTEVLTNLHEAFSGLTQEQELTAASAIFGKNQMAKWLTLIQASPEDVKGLRSALDDCTGSADNMSNALMSGTGGTIESLKSTFDVLTVTIGEAVAPAFQSLMEKVIDVMNAIMDMDPATQKMVLAFAAIAAGVGPALIAIGKLAVGVGAVMKMAPKIVSTIKLVGSGISSLFSALAANPIGLVVVAIAALVAGFIYLWNTSESFRNFWIGLWDKIKSVVSTAVDAIKGFFEKLGDVFSGIGDKLQDVWSTVTDFFSGIGEKIGGFFSAAGEAVSAGWQTIKNIFSVGIQLIVEVLSAAKDILLLPWTFIWENFGPVLTDAWDGFKNTISSALDAIQNVISTVWNAIVSFMTPILQAIATSVTTEWNVIKDVTSTVFNAVSSFLSTIWNGIKSFLTTIFTAIAASAQAEWQMISNVTTTIFNAIKAFMTTVWNGIKAVITIVVNAIKSVVTSVFNAIKSTITSIMNAVKGVITSVWNSIKGTVTSVVNGISSTISSVFNGIKNTATTVWNAIKDAIIRPVEAARDAVKNAIDRMRSFFNFTWSLPHLALPHFSVSGHFSLNPPSVPHFGVDWYKKAMDGGMILNGATIFGQKGSSLLAGGEAGPEAVVGVRSLQQMIQSAVNGASGGAVNNTVTINVYSQPGQDISSLADEIETRINNNVMRRKAVFS